MSNTIQLSVTKISALELINELRHDMEELRQRNALLEQAFDENFQLRQIIEKQSKVIDEMTNALAMQKELIQQLRDEIAILKGQKPKPKIPPSSLEGPRSKLDLNKRISP
ncbi:MAG: hypothetical protein V4489_07820, partial [Chlamydiota bacterium]